MNNVFPNQSILAFEDLTSEYKLIREHSLDKAKTWFPLYPTKELAQIAAALMTDGHIDWNTYDENPRPKKLVLYSNKKEECEWFLKQVMDLFHESGQVVQYKSNTGYSRVQSYKAVVYCAQLARLLIKIGIPCGDKTKKAYLIPHWIMNGDLEMKKGFLRTLFTFDGSIAKKSRNVLDVSLTFSMNKKEEFVQNGKEFLEQVKNLLKEIEVKAGNIHIRRCQKDKFTLILSICNQESAVNFFKNVGFLCPQKQRRLEDLVHMIYLHGKVDSEFAVRILVELKIKTGTDKRTIEQINKIAGTVYTYRQFEHMRRNEDRIPIRMITSAIKLLDKPTYFDGLPQYCRELILLYDQSSPAINLSNAFLASSSLI